MDDIKTLACSAWLKRILGLLPCTCRICRRPARNLLCGTCRQELYYGEEVCVQCAEKLPRDFILSRPQKIPRCGSCISNPPPFYRTIFAYSYADPLSRLIRQFKFDQALILSQLLADMIEDRISAHHPDYPLPDALIPVPLHSSRLKQRGFNQSLELARHLGKALGIPVYRNLLLRSRATPEQSGLNRRAREKNLKGAFEICAPSVSAKLAGKHLALVDDVITTGSTAREASRTLKQLKPEKISLLAIAKTFHGAGP